MSLPAPSAALDKALASHDVEWATQLCRRDVLKINPALDGTQDILVACTQEAPLFSELAERKQTIAPIRFVNIREHAGWGAHAGQDRQGQIAVNKAEESRRLEVLSHAKMAALLEMASREVIDPVPSVSYQSAGRVLVIGSGPRTLEWADRLHTLGQLQAASLSVTALLVGSAGNVRLADQVRRFPVLAGALMSLDGWLGKFKARWSQQNAIDLDSCVRCGACVQACPSQAIGWNLQVDLNKCDSARACVKACGAIGAIDFDRIDKDREADFDLVLDLRDQTISLADTFSQFHPPQGYYRPGLDDVAAMQDAMTLISKVGEFEKPKYFTYDARICAHGRNKKLGCNQCIEVCSTQAIRSLGDKVEVEPSLCMGCGACSTVCPSGAMSYAYPVTDRIAERVRRGLSTFRHMLADPASELGPVIVFADEASRSSLDRLVTSMRSGGLPPDWLPVFVQDVASIGMNLMLAALAYGARRVVVLFAKNAAPQYVAASTFQAGIACEILLPLLGRRIQGGFMPEDSPPTRFVTVLQEGSSTLGLAIEEDLQWAASARRSLRPSAFRGEPATFALPGEKRRAVELVVGHFQKLAATWSGPLSAESGLPDVPTAISLSPGAPFGRLNIDSEKCTLCMACIGACPEGALLDGQQAGEDKPQLRFLEKNCVQCGLCDKTCPEQAISLEARWNFEAGREHQVVVNEARPFHCVKCGKAFGTLLMIENMMAKLAGHSAFSGAALERLKMCSDCRVVDMYSDTNQASIHDVRRGQ